MTETHNTKPRLRGLVAQIVNERELAINIGENHGVKKGMVFAVLAKSLLEIRDPETNEVLDSLEREKVRVEVTIVRPKIAICRTYKKKYVPAGPFGFNTIELLSKSSREVIETLKADDSSYPEPLSEDESYVKIGDPVVHVE